jgi:D-alanine-D-alanine ligase
LSPGWDLPLVIKPVETGSSVGMSIVRSGIIVGCCGGKGNGIYGATVMIEAYITGTEITCGVLGNEDPEALAADRDHSRRRP